MIKLLDTKTPRRKSKCSECPYKCNVAKLTVQELGEARWTPNQEFHCHTDAENKSSVTCRGHWEAAKYAERHGIEPRVPPEYRDDPSFIL